MAEAKAQLRRLRISPKKTRLVARVIKGLSVEEARSQLAFMNKKASRPVLKLLESAAANAVNNHGIKKEGLKVKSVAVDQGPTLSRWRPRAFGRATPIRKRSSHVTIIVEGEEDKKRARLRQGASAGEEKAKKASRNNRSGPVTEADKQADDATAKGPDVEKAPPADKPVPKDAQDEKDQEIKDVRREAKRRDTGHFDTLEKKDEGGKKRRIFRRRSG